MVEDSGPNVGLAVHTVTSEAWTLCRALPYNNILSNISVDSARAQCDSCECKHYNTDGRLRSIKLDPWGVGYSVNC